MSRPWLEVTNWKELQNYKHRNPPWIRFYSRLLDNEDFDCLQDASKLHLLLIWLLASRKENRLPDDAAWIQRKIGTKTKPDIDILVTAGFLVRCGLCKQDASNVLADGKQNATPEKSREEKSREEKRTTSPEPVALADFPCVGKDYQPKTWDLTEAHLAELQVAYPGIDAHAQALEARQWCRNNPSNRKTHRGMGKFINGWMQRNQNRGSGGNHGKPTFQHKSRAGIEEIMRRRGWDNHDKGETPVCHPDGNGLCVPEPGDRSGDAGRIPATPD